MSETMQAVASKLPFARIAWVVGLLVVGSSLVELPVMEPLAPALRYVGEGLLAYSGIKALKR